MKTISIILMGILMTANMALGFSNSLDGTKQNGSGNIFSGGSTPNSINKSQIGQPFNPKEHTGFEHQDKNFPDPSMNDTRYNSNCQFGTCSPGGLSPNNK